MTITTIVVAGILSVLSVNLASSIVAQSVEDKVQSTLHQKAGALANPVKFKVVDKIAEEISSTLLALGDAGVGLVVVDVNGQLLGSSDLASELSTTLQAYAMQAVESGEGGASTAQDALFLPIIAGKSGKVVGGVALSWSAGPALTALIPQKLMIAGWAFAVFVVMSGLTVLALRRSLGRPMAQLSEAVDRVSGGDYETEIDLVQRNDEIGEVARHLEALMQKLQAARETEEQKEQERDAQIAVVERLGTGLMQLADGLLYEEIEEAFPGRYQLLQQNFNNALSGLRGAIGSVNDNSNNLLGLADEMAQASTDLSRRTETQAATLEQSAAALDQMLATIKDAAVAAEQTEAAVRTTSDLASNSGTVMQSAIGAMGEIEKSSVQINDIIAVIDDIAFQTNLLALNAGVEAARAGESGKGFAVVAAEVHGLAQRSAEAAQQIKDLINCSTDQIQEGVYLVQSAGSALEEVMTHVSSISDMVGNISRRANDQADGLNEINVGVTNLDRVTQENAAMVQQATSAANRMRSEASGLRNLVDSFVLAPGEQAQKQSGKGAEAA